MFELQFKNPEAQCAPRWRELRSTLKTILFEAKYFTQQYELSMKYNYGSTLDIDETKLRLTKWCNECFNKFDDLRRDVLRFVLLGRKSGDAHAEYFYRWMFKRIAVDMSIINETMRVVYQTPVGGYPHARSIYDIAMRTFAEHAAEASDSSDYGSEEEEEYSDGEAKGEYVPWNCTRAYSPPPPIQRLSRIQ